MAGLTAQGHECGYWGSSMWICVFMESHHILRLHTPDSLDVQNRDKQFSGVKSGSDCARCNQGTHTVHNWGSSLKMCSTSLKLTAASGAHLPVLLSSDKMAVGDLIN